MSRATVNQLNQELLKAFGIHTRHVTEAYIQLRPNHLPTAIVESVAWPTEVMGDEIKRITQTFRMEPVEPPAPEPAPPLLDIAAMCNTALHCIFVAIERAGDEALHQMALRSAAYNSKHGYLLSRSHMRAAAIERSRATTDFKPLGQFLKEWKPNA